MKAFVSHNKEDKATARLIATSLVELGIGVWFDEWNLRPGDSITGGIESGITDCDIFVLLWSRHAARSNWVGTEVRAVVRRRVDDHSLRIVPIMLDETPLPALVADYRGFSLETIEDMRAIANEIACVRDSKDVAQLLQQRLLELAAAELPENPIRVLVCPKCASKNITYQSVPDMLSDAVFYYVMCNDCEWGESKKAKPSTSQLDQPEHGE